MVICTLGSRRAGCDGLSGSWTGVAGKAGGLALPTAGQAPAGLLAQAKPRRCCLHAQLDANVPSEVIKRGKTKPHLPVDPQRLSKTPLGQR